MGGAPVPCQCALRNWGERLIRQSFLEEHALPWSSESLWTQILMQDESVNGKPRFYRPDIWHVVQMGVGKDFASAAMVLLVRVLPATNVDDRFALLSDMYLRWCREFKKTRYIRKIDKRFVGGAGLRDEPHGAWNKAALTVTILEFLQYFCEQHKEVLMEHTDVRLRYVFAAVTALNTFMSGLYHQDLWIPSSEAKRLAAQGMRFVKMFMYLAHLSAMEGQPYFALRPKLHLLHECAVWLDIQSARAAFAFNVLAESCSLDEDFVGRLAFVSRTVSPRLVSQRSIERYLVQIQLSWSEPESAR